jgi:cysteine desulfurase
MLPYFSEQYGNPGSIGHAYGEAAREAVHRAAASIASAISSEPSEIVFTSGATESNNLAIRGIAELKRRRGDHFISVRTEHKAVLDPLARLARRGAEVTLLEVEQHGTDNAGWLDPRRVAEALRDDTALVSVMLANNEIGVIQPLREIAAICRERGVPLHCDATQAVGKIPVNVKDLGIDLMSFSGHKIYGPKGIGALYVRRTRPAIRLEPLIAGGGQQDGLRSGTLNVPGIVGLARALELCQEELPSEIPRLARLRRRLWSGLNERLASLELCGPTWDDADQYDQPRRLPGNLDVAFGDVDGEALLLAMSYLAISSGAACSSTDPGPSHVLLALGMSEDAARSTLRFGLGRFNTPEEVDVAVEAVAAAVRQLRGLR